MTPPRLLIVDDQPDNLDVLVTFLAESNLQLAIATSGEEALELAAEMPPQLVLLDVMMPGINGFETCKRLKQLPGCQQLPVIFLSALSDPDSRVKGFAAGGIDYISKPLHRQEVLARIQAQLTIQQQQQELQRRNQQLEELNRELQQQIDRRQRAEAELTLSQTTLSALTQQEARRWGLDAFVGQSSRILALLEQLRNLQQAPDTNVLVLGESGTGKELVSRAIHYGSQRSDKPFIAVNCAAIPAELADAEFFGHSKGAYTGAVSDRIGYFEQANGGTLFLDEIGDMPLTLQTKLLRVLEDGLVTPIGSQRQKRVDVRVVAATNVNLLQRVQQQQFRQDLYYRLTGYRLELPALRQRSSDIALLTQHFIEQLSQQMRRAAPRISQQALDALSRYHFPGNVRELRNMIEFALIACRDQCIDLPQLHFAEPLDASLPEPAATTVATSPAVIPPTPLNPVSNDEQQLLAYVRQHGRIDNTSAQQLLQVDHSRASYLLKKLYKEGQLQKQGERRWSYYQLPE
ncbi:sigma-54-dependent transcriptional regulator [Oceanobacter mangrovi]|uniref:sigma-54-dependent transcriptional regulator n=1 Tax=Oceanobacter mangrovi TaxID=2862510 RepID=UPI001C8DB1F4|nr:sigma-54 dependent transcriptional regulator [Oceanobacter mangrovi]